MVRLNPSIGALKKLLYMCEEYAVTQGLRYNSFKREFMVSQRLEQLGADVVSSITLGGSQMTTTNKREIYEKLLQIDMEIDQLLEDKNKAIKVLLLHKYNDIKDATQVVINHIANIEESTVTEIHERLGLEN